MRSWKSDSGSSRPPKRAKPRLKKALKRRPRVRHINNGDLPWLWAAYRKGSFDDVLPKDLDREEFIAGLLEVLERFNHEWILDAPNDASSSEKPVPVGLIAAQGGGRIIEPHAVWFPWASDRNKLEAMLAFLSRVSTQYKIFAYIHPDNKPFYVQMCRYGQLTMGCKIHDYYDMGEDAYFFYTRGPK